MTIKIFQPGDKVRVLFLAEDEENNQVAEVMSAEVKAVDGDFYQVKMADGEITESSNRRTYRTKIQAIDALLKYCKTMLGEYTPQFINKYK